MSEQFIYLFSLLFLEGPHVAAYALVPLHMAIPARPFGFTNSQFS
jgi:hypothetical protein